MAQKPEAKYKQAVHRHLDASIHHQGMYTPFSAGTPDHWYSGVEDDLWIEFKWDDAAPRRVHLCNPQVKYPKMSGKQQQWLRARYSEGRNVAVVYATKEGGIILEALAWEYPLDKEVFLTRAITAKEVALWISRKVSVKKHVAAIRKEVVPI